MSKETREHISSLMDGEISREASRFLVRRLGTDDELCATWARYHVVRDCLRNQDGLLAGDDLCTRVSRAIDGEPAPRQARGRWLRPVAGAAIAASVALVAVMAVGPGRPTVPEANPGLVAQPGGETFTSPQGLSLGGPTASQAAANPVTSQRMNAYLLRHYQATGASGRGFVAIVPLVASDDSSVADSQVAEETEDSGVANPR